MHGNDGRFRFWHPAKRPVFNQFNAAPADLNEHGFEAPVNAGGPEPRRKEVVCE